MTEINVYELEDVNVEVIRKNKTTRINIVVDGKKQCLSYERTNALSFLNFTVTERYIVACLDYEKRVGKENRVAGLYDRKEKRIVQVTKANRDVIKYSLLCKKAVYLSTVLEYLNHGKAEAATEEEVEEFTSFLTSNREIPRNEIEAWIYKSYPMLESFANRDEPLKFEVYLAALQAVGKEDLYFYAMPITF